MLIVIVEDDENKRKQLVKCIQGLLPKSEIVERQSYQSGLKEIVLSSPDIVILDMSMPTYDVTPKDKGGRTRAYAGRDILDEIVRRGLEVPIIVVTQYETFGEPDDQKSLEQLKTELQQNYPNIYRGAVYYQPAQSDWKNALENLIADLISAED